MALLPIAGLALLALTFLVLSLRRKKHLTKPYLPTTSPPPGEGNDYFRDHVNILTQNGFSPAGTGTLLSLPTTSRAAAFLSSDQMTLAACEGGSLLLAPILRTGFYSRLPDGRYLVTTDAVRGKDDVSGLTAYVSASNIGCSDENKYEERKTRDQDSLSARKTHAQQFHAR